MNAIQSIIAEDQDAASTLLAKFARLLRKILDYSDLDKITLEQEAAFLKEYLYLNIELRFGNSMTYHIHIDDDLEDDLARIPSMIVQPFVENAIEHGLKPQKGGHISIIFQPEGDDRLRCIVEDNGVGRGELRNRNESRDQVLRKTPRGTGITEQRIALIGQSFASPCDVTYTDLSHTNGTPAGTRVDIVMPLEYD
jgi:sensor histidine kinase YesM